MDFIEKVREYAVSEVWAKPYLDKQFTFIPSRITTKRGVRGILRIPYSTIYLPNTSERFVVFEMGQISPRIFGFDGIYSDWVRLDQVALNQSLVTTIHLDYLVIPNSTAYVKRTGNRNFLLAIEFEPNKESFHKKDDLHVRFYSNAWFATEQGRRVEAVNYYGGVVSEVGIPEILSTWNGWRSREDGEVLAFVNGYYTSLLTGKMLSPSDFVEIYFDASIEGYFDVYLDDLEHFDSKLDATRKLLLMKPDTFPIDFHFYDDLEFFICNPTSKEGIAFNKGAYYSRTNYRDVRQVTQQDWAISMEKVRRIISEQEGELSYSSCFVRVFLRKSVGPEPYLQNANYTHDLFLLPFEERERLMAGPSAVIDEWKASNLEVSSYNMFVSSPMADIDEVSKVFSYYGVDKILERQKRGSDGRLLQPPSMFRGGLVAEYDKDGKIVRFNELEKADFNYRYNPHPDTVAVNFYPGRSIVNLQELDENSLYAGESLSIWNELRFYKEKDRGWVIAEPGVDWTVSEGKVYWSSRLSSADRRKRDSSKYYFNHFNMHRDMVGLEHRIFDISGEPETGFWFKRLEVWMNGRKLVRGVDYKVNFPNWTLHCEEYIDGEMVDIHLLAHGVPDALDDEVVWGFFYGDTLPKQDRFNLHLFRNKEVSVSGCRINPQTISYGEGYSGLDYIEGSLPSRFREGALWGIEKPLSHVNYLNWHGFGVDPLTADEKTKGIENYLTKIYHDKPNPLIIFIPEKHTLVSEGMRTVLRAMEDNVLNVTRSNLSDVAMGLYLKDWFGYIENDVQTLDAEPSFVEIVPHAMSKTIKLTAPEYQFFVRMNELYYGGRVVLNNYFTV